MFDLDQSIAAWRREMLTAGLTTPATLDELESHLREDCGQQMLAGLTAESAFQFAVARLGQVELLQPQFALADTARGSSSFQLVGQFQNFFLTDLETTPILLLGWASALLRIVCGLFVILFAAGFLLHIPLVISNEKFNLVSLIEVPLFLLPGLWMLWAAYKIFRWKPSTPPSSLPPVLATPTSFRLSKNTGAGEICLLFGVLLTCIDIFLPRFSYLLTGMGIWLIILGAFLKRSSRLLTQSSHKP